MSRPGGRPRVSRLSATQWAVALALPLAGLALLLAQPALDLAWEHQPSHFWLVLGTAVISVGLAFVTNVAAGRHRDARIVLVSLAFLASAGFLGLHALATPGVLLDAPNAGFAVATPAGLFIASLFAAASVTALAGPRAAVVLRHRDLLLGALVALMLGWAFVSLAGLPPLGGPLPAREAVGPLVLFAALGVPLYAWSAWRCLAQYRRRGGTVLLAMAVAMVLLGEAAVAVALSRNWHLSWWEWHVLMLLAFLAIALGARAEYRRSGSLAAAFGGLYLETTLARLDRWHAGAIAAVAASDEGGAERERVLDDLRRDGASADEIALVTRAAGEIRQLDARLGPYLPAHLAGHLGHVPDAGLGGVERDVSVLFADLAGFTAFSELRAPSEVVAMLNAYWAEVVPAIVGSGGAVEHFAGDGVMASFNGAGDQPDHAGRAATAALAIIAAGGRLAGANPGWPVFRVGVSTGAAVVGDVGAAERRSFTVIGDTTNVAARLTSVAEPGQVVVSGATWTALGPACAGRPLGPTPVKGKRQPVEAWILDGLDQPAQHGELDLQQDATEGAVPAGRGDPA